MFIFLNISGSYRGQCFGSNRILGLPKFGNGSFGSVLLGAVLYVFNAAVYGVCKFKSR